jgi:hypothetical protein
MRHRILTAAALFLPLTAMSCPGEVSSQLGANTAIHSTGGSAELDVTDIPNGCHNWHAQGSITLMDVLIECSYNPETHAFTKTASVKSADPLQELIEANKNQQAITGQLLQALQAALAALAPKPVP